MDECEDGCANRSPFAAVEEVRVLRQMPSAARVARLRRRLGVADTRPFAPLPPRRRGRGRAYHDKLVAMIHDEEAKLLEHLGGVVHDLKRTWRQQREPQS